MLVLFGFFVACIVVAEILVPLLPMLFEAALLLLAFLLRCLFTGVGFVARGAWRALIHAGNGAARFGVRAWPFASILFDAARRRAQEANETRDDGEEDENAQDSADAAYEGALAVFGLARGAALTREKVSRRYKSLIKRAHPDVPGGSHAAAQAVNAARDLLFRRHGWA